MHPDSGFSLQRHYSFEAIGTEYDLFVALAFEHFPMHLAVAHAVSTFAAGRIHHDFARDPTQRRIEKQRPSFQMKSSPNRVKYIAEGEVDDRVLRIELNGYALRSSLRLDAYEKCNRAEEGMPHSGSAKSPPVSFDRVTQSVAPIPERAYREREEGPKSSHVKGQQSAKNCGPLAKNLEDPLLESRTAVEREHQSRH